MKTEGASPPFLEKLEDQGLCYHIHPDTGKEIPENSMFKRPANWGDGGAEEYIHIHATSRNQAITKSRTLFLRQGVDLDHVPAENKETKDMGVDGYRKKGFAVGIKS